ncbi:MAG TPA: thioredoxin domain-containing protein [Thermomicrobiales bacterium]|nr:thioredoxin domain-containing protein [Thermomicrobiales bacterium]
MLLLEAGTLAIALVAVVALVLANQDDETEAPEAALALEEVENDGRVLGDPDAPVDFVVYSDFQCPFCRQFDDQDLPQVVDTFVDTGDVRVEWRPLPIVSGFQNIPPEADENESVQSAEAALCAAD